MELSNQAPSKREFFLFILRHSCKWSRERFPDTSKKCFCTHLAQNAIPIL